MSEMKSGYNEFNRRMLNYINSSVTPFHATQNSVLILEKAGFKRLEESEKWGTLHSGKYFVTRDASSLIAFTLADNYADDGFKICAAHTDSPSLKLKPNPVMRKGSSVQLSVEVYGSPLLNTWFDRDLAIAGRISYTDMNGKLLSKLVDTKKPIAVIPSLAIHLDREANKGRAINEQNDINPLAALASFTSQSEIIDLILKFSDEPGFDKFPYNSSFDLYLYDSNPACLSGFSDEIITGSRLDNLVSCFIAVESISSCKYPNNNNMILLSDHEEVGSSSRTGACGNFLTSILKRIHTDNENLTSASEKTIIISMDNAHAVHPNFMERHDPNHSPELNRGPVIKTNSKLRYATNSETMSFLRYLCDKAGIEYQYFVSRNDIPCGSTVGPLLSTETGIKAVDVGIPTLGMHSIRETAGCSDAWNLGKVIDMLFSSK